METTIPALPAGTSACTRCDGLGLIGTGEFTRRCPRCQGRRYEPRRKPEPFTPETAAPYLAELRSIGDQRRYWQFDKTDEGAVRRRELDNEVRRIVRRVAGRIPISGDAGMAAALGVSPQQFNNIQAGDPTGKRR